MRVHEKAAALLRSAADRLDPATKPAAVATTMRTRRETRLLQYQVAVVFLRYGEEHGLEVLECMPRAALEVVHYFAGEELALRDRDFDRVEQGLATGAWP